MKRLFVAIVALCLIATGASSFWQSRDSNYNVGISAGGGPPSYTFIGNLNNGASLTVTGALNLGVSNSQLIVVTLASTTSTTVTSVTVAGTSLSPIVNFASGAAVFAGVVAANGSQTVTAVFAGGQFNNKGLSLYTVNGLASTTAQGSTSWAAGNGSLSVTAGDVLFATDANSAAACGTWGSSTQAPAAVRCVVTNPSVQGADWVIVSTNAAFSLNSTVAGQTANAAANWH